MGRRWNVICLLYLLFLVAAQICLSQSVKGPSEDVGNFVRKSFFLTHSSGSLLLSRKCTENGEVSAPLSKTPEGRFNTIDDALAALSKSNPEFTWNRDSAGMIRIRDQRTEDDVLHIRLKHLYFKGVTNSGEAVHDIVSEPAVREYFKRNRIEYGLVFNHLGASTSNTRTLSGDVKDITVGEALDLVVRFFPGLWTYSECKTAGGRRVVIDAFAVDSPTVPERDTGDRMK